MLELLLITVSLVGVCVACLLLLPISVEEKEYRSRQDKVMLMMMEQGM